MLDTSPSILEVVQCQILLERVQRHQIARTGGAKEARHQQPSAPHRTNRARKCNQRRRERSTAPPSLSCPTFPLRLGVEGVERGGENSRQTLRFLFSCQKSLFDFRKHRHVNFYMKWLHRNFKCHQSLWPDARRSISATFPGMAEQCLRQGQSFVMQHWNAFSLLGAAVLLVGISLSDFAEGQPLVSRTAGVLPPPSSLCDRLQDSHTRTLSRNRGQFSDVEVGPSHATPNRLRR